jgi:hypothetical protein
LAKFDSKFGKLWHDCKITIERHRAPRMTQSPPTLKLELTLRADQPELLTGLDYWLQLGLISEAQIDRISQRLSCPLPQESTSSSASAPAPAAAQSWLTQALGSFMAEVSVVWLLFLGVFMVVVSSGVLAASQWQNFSAVGQYSILWAYTLAFGVAGWWAGQRPTLQTTGRMLRVATLLIIPVNFWMIDGFRLWGTSLGWLVSAIASLSLAAITTRFLQQSSRLTWINQLALCGLQWGWGIPGWALAATYGATVGTAGLQIWQRQQDDLQSEPLPAQTGFDLGNVAIAFSTLLLLGRALWAQQIPISDLGLAFGICGWLLVWVNRQAQRPLWNPVGAGLLAIGWGVTVDYQLGQALGVSLLALWLLGDRLWRLWRKSDLLLLILVGLQTYALLRAIVPPTVRSSFIAWVTAQAGLQLGAVELVGLSFFPYVLVLLGFAVYLRRQPPLALLTEQCALGLGLLLLIPGIFNPLVRSLYLSLSIITLSVKVSHRSAQNPVNQSLIYLTHITGLFTIFSWIDTIAPSLAPQSWMFILLGLAAMEWGGCELLNRQNSDWRKSAATLGNGLMGLNLLALTSYITASLLNPTQGISGQIPLLCGLSVLTIALRQSRQRAEGGLLGLAWAIELLSASLISWMGGGWEQWAWEQWAIANLALGMATQIIGDYTLRRAESPMANWLSLHTIPLFYATLGGVIAHTELTATTGFYTLAAALPWLGVARRRSTFEGLSYVGIAGLVAALWQGLYGLFPKEILLAWSSPIASLLSAILYLLPWSRWGWQPRPWQRSAMALPSLSALGTSGYITVPALFLTAAFYAWLARISHQIRLSYIGLVLANWGIFQFFGTRSLTHPLWYVSVVSISILYIVQVDPQLRTTSAKQTRHQLRCLAIALVGITALYQADSWGQGLGVIGFSLGAIAIGITLRVRAYLFVGTLIFLAQVLRQLWLFIDDYSIMLWGLGILLGLVLIWIAATFEARRNQAIALLQYWATELDQWE